MKLEELRKFLDELNEITQNSAKNRYTAQEIYQATVDAYYDLDYNKFVETVLDAAPNGADVWQIEKWELFQAVFRAILRIPPEYLDRMLKSYAKRGPKYKGN